MNQVAGSLIILRRTVGDIKSLLKITEAKTINIKIKRLEVAVMKKTTEDDIRALKTDSG